MKPLVKEMLSKDSFQNLRKEQRDSGIDFRSEVLSILFRAG